MHGCIWSTWCSRDPPPDAAGRETLHKVEICIRGKESRVVGREYCCLLSVYLAADLQHSPETFWHYITVCCWSAAPSLSLSVQVNPTHRAGSPCTEQTQTSSFSFEGKLLKRGQFTPKTKRHIFPLTCSVFYQSREFWCELSSLGDISRRDFCLLCIIIGLNGALLVVLY